MRFSLNLDQLANVDYSLYIGTTNSTQDAEVVLFMSIPTAVNAPIGIEMPALVNVTLMKLWGNISR